MAIAKTDYLIIGNSAAGVTAAETIRIHDDKGTITILSKEPYAVYGRPLISYLIEGKTSEDQIGFKDVDFYESHAIEAMLGPAYEAVKLMPEQHTVKLANNDEIRYGKCLLATGSNPFTPPLKGLKGKTNVYTFITLDDAKEVWDAALDATKSAHEKGTTSKVVIIGAGLIGLKAAEALSHHVDEVLVLELAPRILPAVLDDEGAALLQRLLEERGIRCMPGVSSEELLGEGDRITGALLTDGSQVECDFVVAAVGVRPNSALAIDAGAQSDRGLVCDDHLMTSLPDVYAAGDVVQVTDVLDGATRPLALWPNAMRQGKIAGQSMAMGKEAETFDGSFPVNAVDFFDISLLTAGMINPAPDSGCEQFITVDAEHYAKFVTRDGKLVGYILLNRPENAGIYTSIIENGIPLEVLDEALFEAAPINMDFPQEFRWERLHPSYPRDRNRLGQKERVIR